MILEIPRQGIKLVDSPEVALTDDYFRAILLGFKAQGMITEKQSGDIRKEALKTLKLVSFHTFKKPSQSSAGYYNQLMPLLINCAEFHADSPLVVQQMDGWDLERRQMLNHAIRLALSMREPVVFFEDQRPIVATKYLPASELRESTEVKYSTGRNHRPMDIKGIAAAILRPPSDGLFTIVKGALIS